ncbi:MAG: PLP-dependent aminotransferase family protein [Dongiaceae bacterium]
MTISTPSLTEKIGAAILARIEARSLAPGARLPSIRGAAMEFGVSKSTIVEAYDRLVAAGHIQARRGSGFTVTTRHAPPSLQELAPKLDRAIDPVWVARQSLETEERALRPGCGWLPESWLPEPDLRRALRGVAQAPHAKLLEYGHPLGYLPLRQALQARLAELEIEAPPTRILLTDGGTQAIDLTLRHLLQPGDSVLVDDPGYFNFHANLRAHRALALPVPRRPDGPDLSQLAELAQRHKPRLYLTNAAPHNPTGAGLSPAVAHRLLQLAEAHDFRIVEDDVFADFRRHPTPILAALDGLKRVIHLGSFSKTLSAGVRCGYVVADDTTIDALLDLKIATAFGSDLVAAQMVHRLIADGTQRKHAERIRRRLATAMGQVAGRLQSLGLAHWQEPREGLFLWMRLPDSHDAAELARRALRHNIVLAPGNVFSPSQSWPDWLRFNAPQSQHQRLFEFLKAELKTRA